MKETIRTFIAIKIEPGLRLLKLLNDSKEYFSTEAVKWVEENNLHITLKFIGDTTEKHVEVIKKLLDKVGRETKMTKFSLKGLGYFKSSGKPRVLFLKAEDYNGIKDIVSAINKDKSAFDIEKEEREFKPHLTLGRIKFIKNREAFYNFVEKYKEIDIQLVDVSEIIFYQSILQSEGPVYKPLKTISLAGN